MDKALIVGINKYPSAPLSGCVNDATDMAEFLVKYYNFNPDSIRLLTDERATTAAILDRLNWLVDGTKAGDRVVFHYSGHGVQVACRNDASEVDGLNECICPVSFNWSPNEMITDKQFYAIFSKMSPGVKFNWISDACHSGGSSREMPFLSFIRKTPKKTPKLYPMLACEQWKIGIAKSKKLILKALINGQLEVGFISGCKSSETSADTVMNGRPQGALTGYLLQAMRNDGTRAMPLNQLVSIVRSNLQIAGYEQQPQSEGSRVDKPFLG